MECEDYLTEIRIKFSNETDLNRSEKRNFSHNARRTDYQKIVKNLEVPNLKEFERVCCYFIQDKKRKDLQRIHLGLSCGSEYIKIFLNKNGSLYALVGCLSGINTKLQMQALHCIINLGFGDIEERYQVCKRSGSYLISLLGGDDLIIQALCCWALGNLCDGSKDICGLVKSQGFEGAVLNAVLSNDPFVIQNGFYALNYYFNVFPERINIVCKTAIIKEFVTTILPSNHAKEFISDFFWCLFLLSTDSLTCRCLVDYGIVSAALKILFNMTNDNCFEKRIITSLVRVLNNCVAVNNRVAIEICYKVNEFVPVVKFLMKSPSSCFHDETLQLIANVVNGAMAQSITGENILEDSNFKQQLEPILHQVLASRCFSLTPECDFIQYYS